MFVDSHTPYMLTNRIAEFRRTILLKSSVFAYHVGISRQALYQIENNKTVPSLVIAFKLAEYLDTSVIELFPFEWLPEERTPGTILELV